MGLFPGLKQVFCSGEKLFLNMFHVSGIVQYKNCDHVIMDINESSGEYILRNLDNGAEIHCKKEGLKKSPIETLEIFKDEWIEKNVSGHKCGNFDLQIFWWIAMMT